MVSDVARLSRTKTRLLPVNGQDDNTLIASVLLDLRAYEQGQRVREACSHRRCRRHGGRTLDRLRPVRSYTTLRDVTATRLPLLDRQVARELGLRNRLLVVLSVVEELDRDHF